MHSQQIRSQPFFLSFVVASVAAGIFVRAFGGDVSKATRPKQASFQVRNEFKVQVAKGAKTVRMWFSVPQEDAVSVIREFNVAADFPIHYYRDDWGNRVGYAEVDAPAEGPITIREGFELTRTETLNDIDPTRTRPLTDQERAALLRICNPRATSSSPTRLNLFPLRSSREKPTPFSLLERFTTGLSKTWITG